MSDQQQQTHTPDHALQHIQLIKARIREIDEELASDWSPSWWRRRSLKRQRRQLRDERWEWIKQGLERHR